MIGKVWLVGAGPGDPSLITVRGREVLEQADVVLYDALSHPALLDFCPNAEHRSVGKRYGRANPPQEWITSQLLELAAQGKRVVRLKGGDPLLFARGAEEALALAEAGIPFEIVPGIASPVAAAAYAGFSLTHRGLSSSVTFITGSDRDNDAWSPEAWRRLATATDTLCVLMGMRRLPEIVAALMEGGRSPETPAAVVQWTARPQQRVVIATLGTLAAQVQAQGLSNPAIVFVGDVVSLRERLRWFDVRPIFGRRLLVVRAERQGRETASQIRARGAEPILFPAIEICPPPEPQRLVDTLTRLPLYDWVVFTSANGVEQTFGALQRLGRDARAFGTARIAAIGPKTQSALRAAGVFPDLVAKEYVGESLAQGIIEQGGQRVLILRALQAREALPELLRQSGAEVDVVPAYQTQPARPAQAEELRRAFTAGEIDAVLFTSSSTVTSLVDLLGPSGSEYLRRTCVACIGPITATTAREQGLQVDVSATTFTIDGLLDALEQHFR